MPLLPWSLLKGGFVLVYNFLLVRWHTTCHVGVRIKITPEPHACLSVSSELNGNISLCWGPCLSLKVVIMQINFGIQGLST